MPRIDPKPLSRYPFFVRWVLRRQHRKYGRILAPSLLWGRLPGPFVAILAALGAFQARRFPIDPALRSLVSIRVAQLNGCDFCVDLNSHNFLRASGAEDKAVAVDRWRESTRYTDRERAAIEYAEAMTERCAGIDDRCLESLRTHFDDDEITGLTAWIAFQNMSAKFNAALGAEEHGFCRLPGAQPPGAD